jgi:hypothetical protein
VNITPRLAPTDGEVLRVVISATWAGCDIV